MLGRPLGICVAVGLMLRIELSYSNIKLAGRFGETVTGEVQCAVTDSV